MFLVSSRAGSLEVYVLRLRWDLDFFQISGYVDVCEVRSRRRQCECARSRVDACALDV